VDLLLILGVYRKILFRDIQGVLGYFDRVGFVLLARYGLGFLSNRRKGEGSTILVVLG